MLKSLKVFLQYGIERVSPFLACKGFEVPRGEIQVWTVFPSLQ